MILFEFLDLAGPERPAMIRSVLFKVIDSAFSAVPLGIAYLATAAVLGDSRAQSLLPFPIDTAPGILAVAGLLLAAYALQWCFFLLSSLDGYKASYRMTSRLRIQLADHLRKLPMGYFHRMEPGGLAHIVMQDVLAIEQVAGLVLPRLVSAVTLAVVAVIATFALDWRMGAAMSLGLVLGIPALVLGHRALRKATLEHGESQARLNSRLLEFIRGIAVIKAYGLSQDQEGLCRRAVADFCAASKHLTWKFVVPAILFPTLLLIGAVAVLMSGAHFLIAGSMAPAAYLLFFLVNLRLIGPLSELMDFSALGQQMQNAVTRVGGILNTPGESETGTAALPARHDIVFSDVSFDYDPDAQLDEGELAAGLHGVSFQIAQNTITALVGETGAGKTTIARLLTRLYAPSRGQITIGGTDIATLSPAQVNRLVSFVSQHVFLFSETVRDNIRLGRAEATDDDIIAAAQAARCHEFIAAMPQGYDTLLQGGGADLSGGERQRISLARAFLQNSRIIVLDEVTSALDVENERLVQEALTELVKNRTVIVIAHRLWTIRTADQILMLDHGRIVEHGTHAVLAGANGRYQNFWNQLQNAPGWRGARSASA
jgi:ABC-type multidrug transport system fused ATPase/permease subunit